VLFVSPICLQLRISHTINTNHDMRFQTNIHTGVNTAI